MRSAQNDLKICEKIGERLEGTGDSRGVMAEDAELIAVAREALSWWIQRAQELEQENQGMRDRLSRLTMETE